MTSSICQEAGLQAVRKNRYVVMPRISKRVQEQRAQAGDDFAFYK